ncbi:aminopeptidase P family protein [Deinococcus sp. KNUC1210]|uniref:M24 family metallopeptidase n=1 Tax=Deinococcus sp. KNUC1210 TaxID=2917691 RepID=UPI001EEFE5AF|nr:M24 family metallopeptidase [Deinococcus sp. KNUC1210]ULH16874.1 aminopeptidase P family protein [Deinococcus sp. KNUC1210]
MQQALDRIQQAIVDSGDASLDGWLIYDFRGLNPHARVLLNLRDALLSRRYFMWVPRQGTPTLIHHRIEGGTWHSMGAGAALNFLPYSAHTELDAHLKTLLHGKRGALEYSPNGAVPYVSMVDAGTMERLRAAGFDPVTSADLLQGFQVWDEEDLAAHRRAVQVLMDAKDAAFRLIHERLKAGQPVTELDAQAVIMEQIAAAGMEAGHPVNVSFGANAADSHYEPSAEQHATLQPGQCVLIDLWAQEPGRPFGDVTWVGYAGQPTQEYLHAWDAVAAARDEGIRMLHQSPGTLEGWEVDRAARTLIDNAGLGEFFVHRLGHNLGVQIHGSGANLDDLETHDTRRVLPGQAVTVEPGVYPMQRGYGIRSEVNLLMTPEGPLLTTPVQAAPFILGEGEWEAVRAAGLGEGGS